MIQAPRQGSGQAAQGAPASIRTAGDSALVLRLANVIDPAINARVIAMADSLRTQAIRGVRDVVPTYHSVAVHFDPLVVEGAVIRSALQRVLAVIGEQPVSVNASVELPVTYGGEYGPDLDAVAAFAGISAQQVIEQHSAATYRVFMLGFVPGFPYMGIVSPQIAMPRRATPRVRVPRGSVGIAGAQTGIYPHSSPGGWQIIGRTPVTLFDPDRKPPAMLAPGDMVRFVASSDVWVPPLGSPKQPGQPTQGRYVTVLRPGLFTTTQDNGRWGYQAYGVSVSGAMDRVSHRLANALVGNAPGAATLEATLVGPELRLEHEATIAVTGGDLSATIDGLAVPLHQAVRCAAGSILRFGERRSGSRVYVAFDGGLDVPPVLGSRSTHVRSEVGGVAGHAVTAGDVIQLGIGRTAASPAVAGLTATSSRAGGARLRVIPGPEDDFFPIEALNTIQRTRFTIGAQSDRMGYRLQGGRVPRRDGNEMISDAAFAGALQVPPSGEPILLMADRQTTGGYPQLATVITADLPLAAQLAPGDWVEFEVCTRAEAVAALAAQEGKLLARG